jgi:hypothetical protein
MRSVKSGTRAANDNIRAGSKKTAPNLKKRVEAALIRNMTVDPKGDLG